MGQGMSLRRQFIAEIAAYFPALYACQQRLHDADRQAAQREIERLARIAEIDGVYRKFFCVLYNSFPNVSCKCKFFFLFAVITIIDEMEHFRRIYNYVQIRVNGGYFMDGMISENLKVMISCYYFQHHTSHHNFINRDLRETARRILIARGDPYEPSAAVERVRNLLPNLPEALAAMEDRLPPMEHPCLGLAGQEPAAPDQQIPDEPLLHYPLPRRRAGDYAEIVELVLEIIE